ncbi:MAG: hypothetical protein P1U68_05800 [Verrucomicrobiales bacterium]|nr:hypothetical protein [Verrucomicrobiales bacterium]
MSIGSEVDPDWPPQIGGYQRKSSGEPASVGVDGSFARIAYENPAESIEVEVSAFSYEDVDDFTRKVNLFVNDTFQATPGGMAENFTQSTSTAFPGTLYFRQDKPSKKISLKVLNSRALLMLFHHSGGAELTPDSIHGFAGPFFEAVSAPPRVPADFNSSFGDRGNPGFSFGPASVDPVEWPALGEESASAALVEPSPDTPARLVELFGGSASFAKYQVSGEDLNLDAVFVPKMADESEEAAFSRVLKPLAKEDGTIRHESSKGFIVTKNDTESFEVWTQLIEDSGFHYGLTTFRNGVLVLVLDPNFVAEDQDVESLVIGVVKSLSAFWTKASD